MGNPDVASSLFNPRVMEAMANIRTSIETIRTEAPGLFQQMFSYGFINLFSPQITVIFLVEYYHQ